MPRASPPPLASSPPRVSSPPLASPPSRASPPLVASPPSGPSPPPLASPPSRHLPRVSPGHSDDLYARLTGFIAKEVGALRRDLTERVDDLGRELTGRVDDLAGRVDYMTGRDTVAALRGDLAGRRWGDRGDGGDHDREGGRDGGGPDGDGRGDYGGGALTGGVEEVATEGEAPMEGGEGVAPKVERTPGVIEELAAR
ncbi:atherin-like [Olea europaea var. sylvestris]|uniref:atherin-like n=1 Tax=Olea europaea var. sylvestris TaxID=158386 RepID=UPI000C1D45AD|nr:atherin-like [Olea europaea var. sylvestris]